MTYVQKGKLKNKEFPKALAAIAEYQSKDRRLLPEIQKNPSVRKILVSNRIGIATVYSRESGVWLDIFLKNGQKILSFRNIFTFCGSLYR